MRPWAGALTMALVGTALGAAGVDQGTVALVGGTVHTIANGTLPEATVLLEGGRISAVGRGIAVPDDAVRVDAAGMHIYPGLIEADTVLGLVEISAVRATRDITETGTVNPGLRAEIAVNPDSELLPVTRAAGIMHVRTTPRGGLISGTGALLRLDGWTWEDLTVAAPVSLQVGWPRLRIDRRPEARVAVKEQEESRDRQIHELREAFRTARAYAAARDAAVAGGPPVPADARWEAMRPALQGTIPVVVDAAEVDQIEAAVRWADEEGLRLVVAAGADAARAADLLREHDVAVILGPVLALPPRPWEPYDTAYTAAARLHAAGVRFCISGGGSSFGAANARNLAHHAAMAAAFGLPREAAIRSITLSAAEILGVADRLGSLEPGKSASVILTDGDPLEIRTRVLRAWLDGREVSMESRHTRLYERYRARP